MTRMLGTASRIVVLAALAAFNAASANHFILPCRDDCTKPRWISVGSLNTARAGHTATVLQDGRVLVAGGEGGRILDSAELYDPASGTWTDAGTMHVPRVGHTATMLLDGRVLVAGGGFDHSSIHGVTETAEIYDPATGMWYATGSMTTPRFAHSAVRLQDGRVLVAGGFNLDSLDSAELYDPATGTWSATGSLGKARYGHTMTLLLDGRVLAARGSDSGDLASTLSGAEIYDPLTGTWSDGGDSGAGSVMHTATLLRDGKVLVAGGYGGGTAGPGAVHAESVLFDPATRRWSRVGNLLSPRYDHAATILPSGEVLIAGGENWSGPPSLQLVNLSSAELFDPETATWTSAAGLNVARAGYTMTLLDDGTVLAAGGDVVAPDYSDEWQSSAELYAALVLQAEAPGAARHRSLRDAAPTSQSATPDVPPRGP